MKSFSLRDPAFLAILSAGGGGSTPDSGLIHLYHFDEATPWSGFADSKGSANMSYTGALAMDTGKFSGAMFTGYDADGGATITPSMIPEASWSIAVWMKFGTSYTTTPEVILFGDANGIHQFYASIGPSAGLIGNQIVVGVENSPSSVSAVSDGVTFGGWFLLTIIWDGSRIGVAINDGTLNQSSIFSYSRGSGGTFNMGTFYGGLPHSPDLPTDWDELAIFNYALSDADRAWLYNSGAGRVLS